eukprot:GHVU01161687.1.p1 GENE.GHVU01161687.1~~GHVU01161687.1.p1  ORF type:complete len:112 (-),score=2.74 GHVU01161687.1:421-756(-)
MHVYMYVHVCMCVCVYVCIHACAYARLCAHAGRWGPSVSAAPLTTQAAKRAMLDYILLDETQRTRTGIHFSPAYFRAPEFVRGMCTHSLTHSQTHSLNGGVCGCGRASIQT